MNREEARREGLQFTSVYERLMQTPPLREAFGRIPKAYWRGRNNLPRLNGWDKTSMAMEAWRAGRDTRKQEVNPNVS